MKENQMDIQAHLEREMVLRLQCEWRESIQDLTWHNPTLAAAMTLPFIVITDMKSLLGQWEPRLQEIRISRSLALNGRWDSVCEVFRHEVAHQLAEHFPEHAQQPPHGKVFKSCCRMIRANPRASGNYKTLEERVWQEEEQEPDRIMGKVKKLMGLAASKNRFEAAAAAAKANALIARYNIDMIRQDTPRTFESIIITAPMLKRSQAVSMASVILKRFYFVESIWVPARVPGRDRVGVVLEITGTRSNVKIAEYVFHYILSFAESSWREYKNSHPGCRSRSGYMTGVVTGFKEKLQAEQQARTEQQARGKGPEQAALVAVDDTRLIRHFQQRYPRIRTRTVYHSSASAAAYSSGKARGRNLNIARGVTSRGGNTGRFIGR